MASPMHARRAKLRSHLVSAKAKLKHHLTPRRLLLLSAASASAFLLLLILRTLSAAASAPVVVHGAQQQQHRHQPAREECDQGVPADVAEALVHYAASNATAWRRTAPEEVAAAARVLSRRAPCNLLVFGLGRGAVLWAALNHGGRTVFLEEDDALVSGVAAGLPGGSSSPALALEAYRVAYLASAADADELLALRDTPDCTGATQQPLPGPLSPGHFDRSPCKLAVRGLPAAFYEAEWDVILVDAPTEAPAPAPGMMGAIYTAAIAARARTGGEATDVVVHDVDQPVQDRFSTAFLCGGYIKEEVGKLRHFAIPSSKEGMPFCP
ncbi:glucuronoxylan 4-O-methyltransferase 2-like [Oryza brachyantha]|uniref:glucuronoxylan 4-O-methyltransferase 2-like n=1 Tax=Oryza brachyantha TaxID=4533 RepID=UPI001AD9C2C9|nr:glucuronoxylan 4-O-methyltransferase 2-like [Oryza brachyantha]